MNCFTQFLQQCKMCNAIPNMTDMPLSRRVNVLGLLFCTRGPEFHLIGHFEYSSKSNTEFQESFMSLCMIFYLSFCISQFHLPPAPPPPGLLLRGIFPPCQSRGWGICKFCPARAPGICNRTLKCLKWHYSTVQSMKNVTVLTEDGAFALLFCPHPGGFDSSRVLTPGDLPS